MTVEICPSMLSANATNLGAELIAVEKAGADAIHWDIMDGNFVEAITFGAQVVAAHRKLTSLRFDVHLMTEHPDTHLDSFIKAGADVIFVHPETCPHLHRTIDTIKSAGKKAGIALNPATDVDCLKYCDADCVLVMSVNPGRSGQKFISSQLKKIAKIKELFPQLKICVDGGISDSTIRACVENGAESFVTGSFLFKSEDYAEAIKSLRVNGCKD